MVQTLVVIVLLIIGAAFVVTNPSAFDGSLALRVPGGVNQFVTVTMRDVMMAAGVALVLAWIAALIDRSALDRRVEHYERTMRVMSDEMLRVKARAYDEERQPLEDVRVRLDTIDRDIRALRSRIEREPAARPAPADTTRVTIKNPSEAA